MPMQSHYSELLFSVTGLLLSEHLHRASAAAGRHHPFHTDVVEMELRKKNKGGI
jgi:hypothetical protein